MNTKMKHMIFCVAALVSLVSMGDVVIFATEEYVDDRTTLRPVTNAGEVAGYTLGIQTNITLVVSNGVCNIVTNNSAAGLNALGLAYWTDTTNAIAQAKPDLSSRTTFLQATNIAESVAVTNQGALAASKKYTDEVVVSAGVITAPIVTNISVGVVREDVRTNYLCTVAAAAAMTNDASLARMSSSRTETPTNSGWLRIADGGGLDVVSSSDYSVGIGEISTGVSQSYVDVGLMLWDESYQYVISEYALPNRSGKLALTSEVEAKSSAVVVGSMSEMDAFRSPYVVLLHDGVPVSSSNLMSVTGVRYYYFLDLSYSYYDLPITSQTKTELTATDSSVSVIVSNPVTIPFTWNPTFVLTNLTSGGAADVLGFRGFVCDQTTAQNADMLDSHDSSFFASCESATNIAMSAVVTNIAMSAAVTNMGAKTYADATFLPLDGFTPMPYDLYVTNGTVYAKQLSAVGEEPYVSCWGIAFCEDGSLYDCSCISMGGDDVGREGQFLFWPVNGGAEDCSVLNPDGSDVATSNMTVRIVDNRAYPKASGETLAAWCVDLTNLYIRASCPAFSNEVLKVGLGIGTNEVAQINAILTEIGETPIGQATTVGGLLLALAAAVAWLKKKKANVSDFSIGSFASYVTELFSGSNTSNNLDNIRKSSSDSTTAKSYIDTQVAAKASMSDLPYGYVALTGASPYALTDNAYNDLPAVTTSGAAITINMPVPATDDKVADVMVHIDLTGLASSATAPTITVSPPTGKKFKFAAIEGDAIVSGNDYVQLYTVTPTSTANTYLVTCTTRKRTIEAEASIFYLDDNGNVVVDTENVLEDGTVEYDGTVLSDGTIEVEVN